MQQTQGDDGEQCIAEIADDGEATRLFCQPRIDALLELPDGAVVTAGDGKRLWRATRGAEPKPWLTTSISRRSPPCAVCDGVEGATLQRA